LLNDKNILSKLNIELNNKYNSKQHELVKVKEELDILKTTYVEVESM
jgi:hypothetical protein